jgi:hypothetical protein
MAKYRNDLEYTVVIPSIGVTVEPGKSFDGPDNLSIAGISNAGKGKESVSVPTVAADLETGE